MSTVGAVLNFHYNSSLLLYIGLIIIVLTMIVWWRDIIREATFQGVHTKTVRTGLRFGMILFITSEVCFFVAFFWAYFYSSVAPNTELGTVWPPIGLEVLDPLAVPLINTAILLSSGVTVTWAHYAIINNNRAGAIQALACTIVLGVLFTALQVIEYYDASFSISDSVYGASFFMATGFHGFHVIIGTIFLAICWMRLVAYHYTPAYHFGLEAASWYWHFVDVV